ncbi:hypothetical protein T459_09752 [Capsicum annuum]|uniref:Membrane protein of ER body-like protein n=1 Tax=Capsicum annuum TaxID=4072 RepID=A0A1U8G642_CAPAN|nr:uncharacterized protein LOC107862966 isoform X1 [Capsicum annuum]KAF3685365.1 putative transmembrane protein -like protein [Capsicum annuum]PHT87646.1 hypothetical protein T459_09752 [Capsicum annuum]
MERVDLKWEQNEVEVDEEEEVGGLKVRSSKAIKEVTNGKIETNGHADSTPMITNGTEKSDLGDDQERSMEHLSDSSNGVEVEEGTEQNEVSVQKIVALNNGVEEATEKSDLDDVLARSTEQLSDSNNEVSVQQIVALNNWFEEGIEAKEKSLQQIAASHNGVEVEEETKPKEESAQQFAASNNGVEEGTEPQEESNQHLVTYTDGAEEGTEPQEVSKQHLVTYTDGVEEGTEPQEVSVQRFLASNNGVEERTEAKEESKQHLLISAIGVEEGAEPKEVSVQQFVASNNGVVEGTEPRKESKQHLVTSTDGVDVEEATETEEKSTQQIVVSDNGVDEGIEAKEESKQHLVSSTDEVEKGTEAEEGPFRSGHSVYYDKDEGIWKCRACSWTLLGKSLGIDWTKIPRGHLDKLMHYPMLDQSELFFSFGSKDSNSISTPSIKEKIDKIPGDEGIQESATLNIQLNGYLKSDNLSSSHAQLSKDLSEVHNIVRKSTTIDEIESADADLINDIDADVNDFDVENVIQKQNTHDLYCPNCKSCITKRVILRKRKRKIRVSGDDVKRNKLVVVGDSKVDASHAQAAGDEVRDVADSSLDGTPPLEADDHQPDREPELFRCLSCFSFFIPTGNGFKLFRMFGEKGNQENVKGEQTPTTNKKWFSIFALNKGKASVEQGNGIGANAVKNDSGVLIPSDDFKDRRSKSLVIKESAPPAHSSSEIAQDSGGKILGSKNQDANMKGKMVINTVGKSENATKSQEGGSVFDIFDEETRNQPGTSAASKKIQGNDRNDELLRTTDRIQVSDGNIVQESVPASNDRKDELLRIGGGVEVSSGNLAQESLPASNDRKDDLLRTGGRIQVSNGDLVQESLPASNDGKDEQLRTGGRIQVGNGDLVQESLPASNDRKDELLRTDGRIQVSDGNRLQDSVPASQQNEVKLLITSTKEESLTIETDLKSDMAILNKDPDNQFLLSSATTAFALNGLDENGKPKYLTQIPQETEQHIEAMLSSESLVANDDNKFQLGSKDGGHHYEVSQHTITKTNIEIHSKQPLKVDEHALISSVKDALSIQDKPDNITNISVEAAANNIPSNDTIINVEAGHETTETASANLGTQIHSVEGQGTDAAEVYKIEIVKSIVFGGLAESVTSLSIVSSATGGDTSTSNILVLAMANLIGGLFIIFDNLWELKRDRFEQASNQIMEKHVDRYREQLGRRENFTLHAVLVVLSYIIFGLVPPVTYGFSFRKSDDKELKIVAVAAASLVCILMLATGKAYVQRAPKPYFKTISTYIILGFTVSGVSYAAGILFKRLLEKLGLFQPSSPPNLFLPEMPGTGAAWASL